ncbi:MAG: PLP-dependent transferase [Christensenellaceae bacterium]|nr:PLP-dependent transferase [Christensenellaceae bacterium]
MSNPYGFETRCVHGRPDRAFEDGARSVSFPIYQTATFGHTFIGHGQFNYTRQDNPTRLHLEETVAALEQGVDAIAFASGMAAISAVMELFSPGDHVICGEDLYGGTTRLFNNVNIKNGVGIEYVDTTDIAKVRAAVRPETKAIYLETPTNPMMNVSDIRACAAVAKETGALLIVDNTFLSPYFQKPLLLGADVVIHSGSKFLSGHNDTISGFVVVKDQALAERVRLLGKTTGGMLAPFDSWLVMRGIKTLALRMEKAQQNALRLAKALRENPHVTAVYYPGLPEHPGHELSLRQTSGFGGMLSFRVDSRETAERVLLGVKLVTFAETLGGTESLITYPLTQTHEMVAEDIRERLGITDTLLRLSVGIEDAEDLLADLTQALEG